MKIKIHFHKVADGATEKYTYRYFKLYFFSSTNWNVNPFDSSGDVKPL